MGPGDHEIDAISIYQVSILGGKPRKLRAGAFRLDLSPDDTQLVYMGMGGVIWLADSDGENPRKLIEPAEWNFLGSPTWSTDGKRVIYRRLSPTEATIESRALGSDTSIVLVRQQGSSLEDTGFAFADDFLMVGDRLIYPVKEPGRGSDQNLWELTLDPETGEPRGEPRRLTDWTGFHFWSLSATEDGSTFSFLNNRSQTDVWVGVLGEGGHRLDDVRRLTLDDRDDLPTSWTPDGRAVVFESERHGSLDLFVQQLDSRNADELVRGDGRQVEARLTPDGRFLLYWEYGASPDAEGPLGRRRLMRIPVGGGPTEAVLELEGFAAIDCATVAGGSCLLTELRLAEKVAVVSLLDPVAGSLGELWRAEIDPRMKAVSALSPDGMRLALVGYLNEARVTVLDAPTGEPLRDLEVTGVPGATFQTVDWSPDGSSLYLSGESPRSLMLFRVDLDDVDGDTATAQVLYEMETGVFTNVVASPDGQSLAFGRLTIGSNVWMVEGL